MNWWVYALGAAVALAAADVMIKLAAGKISTNLGLLFYGLVPLIWSGIWLALDPSRGMAVPATRFGIFCAIGVAVTFTLVTLGLYAAFQAGAPISLVSPAVRLAGLLLASIVGVIFLKEPVTLRYVAGMVLACAGMYLIVTR
ncbi:MAG TPA: hypothetical protein VEH27_16615 [Methylomirabilota bacterium]|nr:hypothetical protein [Methylomirabilota bacterium]